MKSLILRLSSFVVLMCCYMGLSAQQVALKTNLISASLGALNGGIELALRPRMTLEVSGSIKPWERAELSVDKYWIVQAEIRHWMCQKYNGSFIGGYINGAQYNVGGKELLFGVFSDLKSHRYEGYLLGAGVTYGYQLILNTHWNIEFSISGGYEYIHYDRYRCPRECAQLDKKGDYHYVGPSKAVIGLIYLF